MTQDKLRKTMKAKLINEVVKVSKDPSKIVDVKIDKKTLPKDEQKVEWRIDIDHDWKNGVFYADEGGDGMFYVESTGDFDYAWSVQQWRSNEPMK